MHAHWFVSWVEIRVNVLNLNANQNSDFNIK